jgi:hypothetical protein
METQVEVEVKDTSKKDVGCATALADCTVQATLSTIQSIPRSYHSSLSKSHLGTASRQVCF